VQFELYQEAEQAWHGRLTAIRSVGPRNAGQDTSLKLRPLAMSAESVGSEAQARRGADVFKAQCRESRKGAAG